MKTPAALLLLGNVIAKDSEKVGKESVEDKMTYELFPAKNEKGNLNPQDFADSKLGDLIFEEPIPKIFDEPLITDVIQVDPQVIKTQSEKKEVVEKVAELEHGAGKEKESDLDPSELEQAEEALGIFGGSTYGRQQPYLQAQVLGMPSQGYEDPQMIAMRNMDSVKQRWGSQDTYNPHQISQQIPH